MVNPRVTSFKSGWKKKKRNKKETWEDKPEKEKIRQASLRPWKPKEDDILQRKVGSTVSNDGKFRCKLTPVL